MWRQSPVCYIENVSSMKMKRIVVKSAAGPYSILSGAGVIRRAAQEIAALGRFSRVHVVSSSRVWRALGTPLQHGLRLSRGSGIHVFGDGASDQNPRRMV